MLKDKLKALLALRGSSSSELAKSKGISKQQQSNKMRSAAYRLSELVELAEFTGTKLAFIDENDKPVIIFDMNDL